jgi:hypothetical protein
LGKKSTISRRVVVAAVAATPMFSTPLVRAEAPLIDANLVMLGQQFAEIVRALDDRDWAVIVLVTWILFPFEGGVTRL